MPQANRPVAVKKNSPMAYIRALPAWTHMLGINREKSIKYTAVFSSKIFFTPYFPKNRYAAIKSRENSFRDQKWVPPPHRV